MVKYYKIFSGRLFPLVVIVFVFTHHDFILGNNHIFHDNFPYLADLILSNRGSSIFEPQLRSAYQTFGIPTWLNSELRIGFDPIIIFALKVISFFQLSLLDSIDLLFTFLFVFMSAGLYLIFTFHKVKKSFQLIFFIYLFTSPFSFSVWGQGYGFLLPFRYIPWVIFFYLRFVNYNKKSDFVLLMIFLTMTFQSYQFIYALIVLLILFFGLNTRDNYRLILNYISKNPLFFILFSLVPIVSIFPLLIAHNSLRTSFQVLPRTIEIPPYHVDFFSTYMGYITNLDFKVSWWHGSAWNGFLPLISILILYFLFFLHKKEVRNGFLYLLKMPGVLVSLLYLATASPVPFSGGRDSLIFNSGTFLGLRNWGFLISVTNVFILIMILYLLQEIYTLKSLKKNDVRLKLIFIIFILFFSLDVRNVSSQRKFLNESWGNINLLKNPSVSFLYEKNLQNTTRTEFLFDPVTFYPFTVEGASIWRVPSMNFNPVDSQYLWRESPTTTITHSYEYRDFFLSKDLSIFKDKEVWDESRFSKPFYVSERLKCLESQEYLTISKFNEQILTTDLLRSNPKTDYLCKNFSNYLDAPNSISVEQLSQEILQVNYESSKSFLLVINQNYDPLFKLRGNIAKSSVIIPVNWRSMGVLLPPGAHTFNLEYSPSQFVTWNYIRFYVFLFATLCVMILRVLRR